MGFCSRTHRHTHTDAWNNIEYINNIKILKYIQNKRTKKLIETMALKSTITDCQENNEWKFVPYQKNNIYPELRLESKQWTWPQDFSCPFNEQTMTSKSMQICLLHIQKHELVPKQDPNMFSLTCRSTEMVTVKTTTQLNSICSFVWLVSWFTIICWLQLEYNSDSQQDE